MSVDRRVLIIGAGPAGLGTGLRLADLGYENWFIYEKEDRVGGLSASFTDDKDFVWDLGGHVLFSGIPAFNTLFEELMEGDYLEHQREAWVRYGSRWVPYPFQNNIRRLPPPDLARCFAGLVRARIGRGGQASSDFRDWIIKTFGKGIADCFMYPYNRKVWAYPLEEMSHEWISERVSIPSLKRIAKNIAFMADDAGWGPNNIFRFPRKGGTGDIFERMAKRIGEKISLGKEINHIDTRRKMVKMTGGEEDGYDLIVNTAPLDELALMLDGSPAEFRTAAGGLESNNVTVVGFGIERPNPSTRCWIYSPDPSVPFYRVTNFSHYSPFNVPGGDVERYSSLMCEKACYKVRPDPDSVAEEMINGLRATGLLEGSDEPVSVYTKVLPKAYPIPTRDRNDRLAVIDKYLKENDIYSIGRFGAWKYEVGNMDHSTMMGMDTADMLVKESIR